ncbi:MAG: hypothetical protein E6K80_00755, partial [Candidatus Eisenbacteria bacterium]
PRAVSIPAFSGRAYGGLASGSARLDLSQAARPRIATQAKLDSVRVEQVLKAFVPSAGWLTGSLGSSIDLQGEVSDLGRSLTATGLASLLDGSLDHSPVFDRLAEIARVPAFKTLRFRELQSNFRIVQGRVFTGPATLRGPQGDWIWSGSVGLDGTLDYAVSVTLPARAPKVAWDPRAMKARLEGHVSEAIAEQRQKFEHTVHDSLLARARAAQDSARAAAERARQAVEDSLRRKGRGLLEGFFRKGAAPDTSRR